MFKVRHVAIIITTLLIEKHTYSLKKHSEVQQRLSVCSRKTCFSFLLQMIAISFLYAGSSYALPIITIDMDPMEPGIQSEKKGHEKQTQLEFNIVVEDIPLPGLNAFQFEFETQFNVIRFGNVLQGDFLTSPLFEVEKSVVTDTIQQRQKLTYALLSLEPDPTKAAFGSGILAKLSYAAPFNGASLLNLSNVILSGPFGRPIQAEVQSGLVTVPEPPSVMILSLGLVLLIILKQRRLEGRGASHPDYYEQAY